MLDATYVPPEVHPDNARTPRHKSRTARHVIAGLQWCGLTAMFTVMIAALCEAAFHRGENIWDQADPFVVRPCEYTSAWIHACAAAVIPWMLIAGAIWYVPRNKRVCETCACAWWLVTRLVVVCALC